MSDIVNLAEYRMRRHIEKQMKEDLGGLLSHDDLGELRIEQPAASSSSEKKKRTASQIYLDDLFFLNN